MSNLIDMEQQFDYSEEAVQALIEWAQSAKMPKEIELSKCEQILDTEKFVKANIYDIKAHYPDSFYNPAIDRLYRLKAKVEIEKSVNLN